MLTTFIVEDSPVILEQLSATLEELTPVRVVGHASDEAAAAAWLARPGHGARLVILDLFLRSGAGMGLLRTLAETPLAPRRVVLTNYATEAVREACHRLGASRVFDKSSELDALIDYCDRLARSGDLGAPGVLGSLD